MKSQSHEITDLLHAWNDGQADAPGDLLTLVYDDLHLQAQRIFDREPTGHTTLQPTALLHEVYLRLIAAKKVRWENRAHFFGAAARLMRQILVDHARERRAAKRGGGSVTVALEDAGDPNVAEPEIDVLALHEALERLAAMDERQSRIVELRYFAGLTIPETAELLGIGPATVNREWRTAKAWLFQELRQA